VIGKHYLIKGPVKGIKRQYTVIRCLSREHYESLIDAIKSGGKLRPRESKLVKGEF
jgi:hypothetical protein